MQRNLYDVRARGGEIIANGHLPSPTETMIMVRRGWFSRLYPCGHRGPRWFVLNIFGSETKKIENAPYCPDCLLTQWRKEVIHCALCGLAIFPGNGVALYPIDDRHFQLSIATKVGESVICCLRFDCDPTGGGAFIGHWTKEGFLPREG